MSESQLWEKIGRQHVSIEQQDAAYTQLLSLLANVLTGEVGPERVLVNLTARTWVLAPVGFRPELPATINGVPACVVGQMPEVAADVPETKIQPE